jgi:hypothetical protein
MKIVKLSLFVYIVPWKHLLNILHKEPSIPLWYVFNNAISLVVCNQPFVASSVQG